MRTGVCLTLGAAIMLGAAQQAPEGQGASGPAAAPTAERPNGDYYPDALVCPEDVPVNARRGTMKFPSNNRQVDAMVYTPREGRNTAVIIMLHGAQGLRPTLAAFDPRALQLASRGYVVVMPQYYDATSGETDRERRNLDRWRDVSADVVAASAQFAGVDPSKVGVWGFSLGGWLAAEGVMRNETLRSAVAVSAGTMAPARSFRRQAPVLMINADADPMVTAKSLKDFTDDLSGRGAQIETLTLDHDAHVPSQPLWCQTFTASREFFDRTLLAP